MKYDVIIVGGASAGLVAGIYSARRNMKTLLITKDIGGQAVLAHTIENYPGFLEISGLELMQKFQEQAIKSGAEIIFGGVVEIKEKNGKFLVKTLKHEHEAKAVILASGKSPRTLEISGEKEFTGKGVSYCAICDMPLFKNKTVAVVGGGNSALDAALHGSEVAKKVYLIHRRDQFRGFEYMVDKIKHKKNIELVLNSVVTEIKGEKFIKSIAVQNVLTKKKKNIDVDGVFVEIGFETKVDFVKDLVKLDENNQIIVNKKCETFYPNSNKIHPGIFAAGDLTDSPFKQIVSSGGEGAKAALQAYIYINHIETPGLSDWAIKGKK